MGFIELVFEKKQICTYNERGRIPDNIMIHSSRKNAIKRELKDRYDIIEVKGEFTRLFGMLIIWTDAISETDIICTYNGK